MSATPSHTEDRLLGGRVILRQPAGGYRAAIDPVFLAASIPASARDHILDIGCGPGAAALCLARRVAGARVTGLEIDRETARLAGDNAALNGLAAEVTAVCGDLLAPPPRLAPGAFDHVMANPPYLDATEATRPADADRARSRVEAGGADLAAWVRFGLRMVRAGGTMTMIHRADRLDALLAALAAVRAGGVVVLPLWPGEGKPAKRVIVRAKKESAAPLALLPGLVVHAEGGRYTPQADAILRDAAALAF